MSQNPTACLVIIGNEILSGRTQDKNLAWLAQQLNEIGVQLREVRVIPDIEDTIIETVNTCRGQYTYLFTTGGIGPTHDDITSASIAKAFGVPLLRHPEAERILTKHYTKDQLNAARLKMADIPEGGTLIANPVSAAPGFRIGNVFVMAGVPAIMQAMFAEIKSTLTPGRKVLSRTLSGFVTEGQIAAELTNIQNRHSDVEIGSYPFFRDGKLGTSLVLRSPDKARIDVVFEELREALESFGKELFEE